MRTTLLAAASALVLSAGIASAAPAITQSAVNMRAGPGTQYPVLTTLPGRAPVDVAGCDGSWCQVNWNGREGYVSANYLQMAGAPGPVAVSPGYYAEPDYAYDDDYYGSPGFFVGPGYRYRHHGDWRRGNNWHNGPGRPGRPPVIGRPGRPGDPGFAGPPANWRGNPGIGAPRASAPTGLRSGGPGFGAPLAAPSGPAISAPAAPAAPGNQGFGTPLAR
jgi:uncharacterized protein YraI